MSTFIEKHPELLDLGKDEMKVFSFLSREGESSAKVISDRCDIPYSKIHGILHKVQQKELIFSRGETPKLFTLRCREPGLISDSARGK
ncbi:helix-turn-helix domain-containing protein [Chloroflexota bacterium]